MSSTEQFTQSDPLQRDQKLRITRLLAVSHPLPRNLVRTLYHSNGNGGLAIPRPVYDRVAVFDTGNLPLPDSINTRSQRNVRKRINAVVPGLKSDVTARVTGVELFGRNVPSILGLTLESRRLQDERDAIAAELDEVEPGDLEHFDEFKFHLALGRASSAEVALEMKEAIADQIPERVVLEGAAIDLMNRIGPDWRQGVR